MAENNIKIFTIKVDTKSGEVKINGITKSFKEAEIALNKLNQQSQATTKTGLNPLTGATGLAGAAVTELGRTVSDLNYGFPAVANNISQLGSLFTILTTKAGGAKGAFQLMLNEMRGPLGILFAFQIGITLLEAFSKGFFDTGKEAKKVSEELKKLKGELASNIVVANQYVKILEDTNTSERKRASVIEELKDLVPSLKDEDFKYGQQLDIVKQKIIDYSIAQAARIEIDKLVEENSELLSERRKINIINEIENEEEKTKAIREYAKENDFNSKRIAGSFGVSGKLIEKTNEEVVESFGKRSEKTIEDSDKILKKINELSVGFENGFVKEKKNAKSRKEFVAKRLSFADDILKSEENVTKQTIHGKEQQLRAESQYQMDLAQFKFDEYKRKEEDRVAAIKDPEDRAKAEKKADEAIKESQNSLSLFKLQKMQETNDLIDIERINDLQKARLRQADFMAKEREDVLAFDVTMAENEMNKISNEKLLSEEIHNNKMQNIKDEIAERILANKSYVDLMEKETNEVNRQERLKTKLKRKEEKTKLAIANKVAQAMMAIAGEGSAVGKAVAVAMAIMNTKEAVTAALGAKPYGPWNIASAVATGVFGLKQVQEIMSTKLPVAGAKSGAGGGASMSVSAPSFNVVGAGGTSQIAEAVTGAQDRPFRAYVVSTEVTSAQELDRKTSAESALG
jgi:hypothetical protein